jgi:hypothetical protein
MHQTHIINRFIRFGVVASAAALLANACGIDGSSPSSNAATT